jgi:hypothetical protein
MGFALAFVCYITWVFGATIGGGRNADLVRLGTHEDFLKSPYALREEPFKKCFLKQVQLMLNEPQ